MAWLSVFPNAQTDVRDCGGIMARGGFSRRRSGIPMNVVGILLAVGVVVVIGALFYLSGQAESKKPPQTEITVEATNVAPH
jgi:hypothetical protein